MRTELQRLINRRKYVSKKINRAEQGAYKRTVSREKRFDWQQELDSLRDSIRVHRGAPR